MNRIHSLVTTEWLHTCIKSQAKSVNNMRVLDASFHLPTANRDARKEFAEKHIPGALFFDINECSDKKSKYSHMLPPAAEFESYVGNLGIDNDTHVVVYDTSSSFGFFSAQRVWWMLRVYGHNLVSVLNGGFVKWCSDGYETSSNVEKVQKKIFEANLRPELIKSYEQIKENIEKKEFQLMDARGSGRFNGTAPEPREDIKPGHILGAKNIPYSSVTSPESKLIKSSEELKSLFTSGGIDLSKPLVATCGSGVSACVIAFAAHIAGKEDVSVYDGSWTEWYQRSTPDIRMCPDDKK